MKDFLRWLAPRALSIGLMTIAVILILVWTSKRYNYCRSLGHPVFYCVGR